MRPAQQAAPLRRRTRRDFLRQAGIAATAALLPGRSQALIQPPNVLMIVIDDLNDWVGFLRGHPDVQTPNLDRLAARSTVFRRAYCNAPVCSPSRASALSGLSVQQTKVFDNNTSPRVANPGIVFLPEHLARNGYEAKLIGKIYHTYSNPTPHPLPATLPATNLQCGAAGSVKPDGAFDWAPLDIDDSLMPDWQFAQSAISFLGQPRSKPFFLGLGLLRTHVAWYLPRKYFDLYPMGSFQLSRFRKGDLDDLPPAARAVARGLGENGCIAAQRLKASAIQAYLASISFVDAQIGRVLDALDASPHAANTAVILWSDNGFHLGEKLHWHKEALWERSTRVPFAISLPGQTSSATVSSPVSLVDLMPTALEICGNITPPYAMAGRSLAPLLVAPSTPWNHPVLITRNQFDYAIRQTRWRYIRYANGDRELYNLAIDPQEWTNLAGDPSLRAVMKRLDALMPPLPAG
jgi:arylsulfatase A-like enzyme